MLFAVHATAATINFTEGAEGNNVIIDANGYTGVGIPPSSTTSAESATYTGYQIGNFGSGTYAVGLYDSAGGLLSDYLKVSWAFQGLIGTFSITQFQFDFKSDVEGQVLLPPAGGFDATAIENGLQTFRVPSTSFNLTMGIQSDVEPSTVPDGGTTAALFGFGLTGIFVIKRFRVVTSV